MAPRIFGLSLGWVPSAAGPVWIVLTVGLLFAAWLTYRQPDDDATRHSGLILGLLALCWLHPLYTWGAEQLESRRIVELGGTVLTLMVALAVTAAVHRTSVRAAGLLVPVLLWLSLASYYLAELLRL